MSPRSEIVYFLKNIDRSRVVIIAKRAPRRTKRGDVMATAAGSATVQGNVLLEKLRSTESGSEQVDMVNELDSKQLKLLLKKMKSQRKLYEKTRQAQGKPSASTALDQPAAAAAAAATDGGIRPVWEDEHVPEAAGRPAAAVQRLGDWRAGLGIVEQPDEPGAGLLPTMSGVARATPYPIEEFRRLMWVAGDSDTPAQSSAEWLAAFVRQWIANTLAQCGDFSLASVAEVMPEACCWFRDWKEKVEGLDTALLLVDQADGTGHTRALAGGGRAAKRRRRKKVETQAAAKLSAGGLASANTDPEHVRDFAQFADQRTQPMSAELHKHFTRCRETSLLQVRLSAQVVHHLQACVPERRCS